MSSAKSFASFFILVVILLHELTQVTVGVPALSPRTAARKPTRRPLVQATTKPSSRSRDARFLGKFSLLAGLGLPDPASTVNRDDYHLYSDTARVPQVAYTFPQSRWGPYVAAVYEPVPIYSYIRSSLGYLAAALNPFNWFSGWPGDNGDSSGGSSPQNSSRPIKAQDNAGEVVLVVHEPADNEIPNEDPNDDKLEFKTEKESLSHEKLQNIIKDVAKIPSDTKKNTDLIAEGATIKLVEAMIRGQNFEDESRQSDDNNTLVMAETTLSDIITTTRKNHRKKQTTTITTTQPTIQSETPPATPPETPLETLPETPPDAPQATPPAEPLETPQATPPATFPAMPPATPPASPPAIPTGIPLGTTVGDTTTEQFTSTLSGNTMPPNVTLQTPYPNRNTLYPSAFNGYYYGGNPQNVSYVQFTTPATVTMNPPSPARLQNFNEINRFLHRQYPTVYYDSFEAQPPAAFDYISRFEQLSPEDNDYYSKNNEFFANSENNWLANGFKPSFPFHL